MIERFGLKQLIIVTVFTVLFTLIDLAVDSFTGIHWTSPRDLLDLLTLAALALLWIWYFVDKFRNK
jgi:hypothetical protein